MRDAGLTQVPYRRNRDGLRALAVMRRETDDFLEFLAVSPDFNEHPKRALPSVQFIDPFRAPCMADHTRNGELLYIDKEGIFR
jgi:hypothetical protein